MKSFKNFLKKQHDDAHGLLNTRRAEFVKDLNILLAVACKFLASNKSGSSDVMFHKIKKFHTTYINILPNLPQFTQYVLDPTWSAEEYANKLGFKK